MARPNRKKRRDRLTDSGSYFAPDGLGSYWVVIPIGDGWIAAQRLARVNGALVVSELRVYPASERKAAVETDRSREQSKSRTAGLVPIPVEAESRESFEVFDWKTKSMTRPTGPIASETDMTNPPPGQWNPDPAVTSVPHGGLTSLLVRKVPIGAGIAAKALDDWLEAILMARPDRLGVAFAFSEQGESATSHMGDGIAATARTKPQSEAREVARKLLGWGEEISAQPTARTKAPRGQKPLDDAFLKRIADDYKKGGTSPAKWIVQKYKRGMPTVLGWIYKARKRGFLPKTKQGQIAHSADRPDWITKAKAQRLLNGESHITTTKGKGK